MAEKNPRAPKQTDVVKDTDAEENQGVETEEPNHELQPEGLMNADVFAVTEYEDRVVFVTVRGEKLIVRKED